MKFKLGDIVRYKHEKTLLGVVVKDDETNNLVIRIHPFIFVSIKEEDWTIAHDIQNK